MATGKARTDQRTELDDIYRSSSYADSCPISCNSARNPNIVDGILIIRQGTATRKLFLKKEKIAIENNEMPNIVKNKPSLCTFPIVQLSENNQRYINSMAVVI